MPSQTTSDPGCAVSQRNILTCCYICPPVPDHVRPRVCSLPEKPYNPRCGDELYRLRTFSITNKGGVVNCGDSIINRRSKSNTSVNSTASSPNGLETSLIGTSCASVKRIISSRSSTTLGLLLVRTFVKYQRGPECSRPTQHCTTEAGVELSPPNTGTPDWDSRSDLLVIGNPVHCESSDLDYATIAILTLHVLTDVSGIITSPDCRHVLTDVSGIITSPDCRHVLTDVSGIITSPDCRHVLTDVSGIITSPDCRHVLTDVSGIITSPDCRHVLTDVSGIITSPDCRHVLTDVSGIITSPDCRHVLTDVSGIITSPDCRHVLTDVSGIITSPDCRHVLTDVSGIITSPDCRHVLTDAGTSLCSIDVISKLVFKMASSDPCSNTELLSLLECPVCYDVMRPPIMHCLNSHNVCSPCRVKIDQCPICKDEFLPSRNVLAEQLSNKVNHPCTNRDHGCRVYRPLSTLYEHEIDCPKRLYECKFGLGRCGTLRCEWKGRYGDIFNHVTKSHLLNSEKNSTKMVFNKGVKKICRLAKMFDELFWVVSKIELEKPYCLAVQYIGPRSCANKFMYEVKCSSKAGGELTFKNSCHHVDQDTDVLLREGPCFRTDHNTLNNFARGVFPEITIYRVRR
uniref:E3 ubiquitin-protein ligase n=1 Tax=Timema genevievae TaxID=629358 RepID=A0A7R9K624_TIMGE|nr:unnamed protein product [Timema genevievae]